MLHDWDKAKSEIIVIKLSTIAYAPELVGFFVDKVSRSYVGA